MVSEFSLNIPSLKCLKISAKRQKMFGKTSKTMEVFSFIISITALYRHNAGKDDDCIVNVKYMVFLRFGPSLIYVLVLLLAVLFF